MFQEKNVLFALTSAFVLLTESLVTKLGDATAFVQSRQRQGFFKTLWNAHETKQELEMLRRNLDSSFQMALFITTLDVRFSHTPATYYFSFFIVAMDLTKFRSHASLICVIYLVKQHGDK